jgi:hypothetical protein
MVGLLYRFFSKPKSGFRYITFLLFTGIPLTIFSTPLSDIRYLLWTIPLFLFFFYSGCEFITGKVLRSHKLYLITPLIAFLLSFMFTSFNFSEIRHLADYIKSYSQNYYREDIIIASDWINSQQIPEPRIMSKYEAIEFYSNGTTVYLPQDVSYEEILEYAKKNKVDYWIAWSEEIGGVKDLNFALKEDAKVEGMTKVFSVDINPRKMIIYRIN